MIRWWTADQHYNHANAVRYCERPQVKPGDLDAQGNWVSPEIAFQRAEQMNAAFMREHNMRVKPDDVVICVGDFACKGGERGVKGLHIPPAELMKSLNGKIVVMNGNHDENNSVKSVFDFMACRIGKYHVGVQHIPLFDEDEYDRWKKNRQANAEVPYKYRMSPDRMRREVFHSEYCRKSFDFMICGHVHQHWKTKVVAGVWHVNVGVDVNRYMPINDQEVVIIFEKEIRGKHEKRIGKVDAGRGCTPQCDCQVS